MKSHYEPLIEAQTPEEPLSASTEKLYRNQQLLEMEDDLDLSMHLVLRISFLEEDILIRAYLVLPGNLLSNSFRSFVRRGILMIGSIRQRRSMNWGHSMAQKDRFRAINVLRICSAILSSVFGGTTEVLPDIWE